MHQYAPKCPGVIILTFPAKL
jgi:hypothetical protein